MTTSTITANITRFEISGETVIAVFSTEQACNDYIDEFSPMENTENWADTVGFADFKKSGNAIIGSSSYHTSDTIIEIFEAGLKL